MKAQWGTQVAALGMAALALGGRVEAQDRPYVPAVGSSERKAIMDTIRRPVEKRLHRRVVFRVRDPAQDFHAQNGWAFVFAELLQPDGKPMGPDYYRGRGDVSASVAALLRRSSGGRWRIVTYVLGPTDVAWEGWDKEYHAPRGIFPRYH